MAELNYAKVYGSALVESFPTSLHFGALYASPNNGRYRFTGGRTVELPTLEVGGRVDVNRDGIDTVTRNFENAWEEKTLSNQRCWSTLVHPKDIDETNLAASIANITAVLQQRAEVSRNGRIYRLENLRRLDGRRQIARRVSRHLRKCAGCFRLADAADERGACPAAGRVLYRDARGHDGAENCGGHDTHAVCSLRKLVT